jgi:hypothetical protein
MENKMQSAVLAHILRKLADAVEKSDITDWEDFDIELRSKKARYKALPAQVGRVTKKGDIRPEEIEDLLEQLTKVSTREAAFEILDKLGLTRKELEALARPRNIHVTKDDNVHRIKEKLVEAIIGSRLNSIAIRGE